MRTAQIGPDLIVIKLFELVHERKRGIADLTMKELENDIPYITV